MCIFGELGAISNGELGGQTVFGFLSIHLTAITLKAFYVSQCKTSFPKIKCVVCLAIF